VSLLVAATLAFAVALLGGVVVVRRRLGVRAVPAGEERWREDPVPRLGGLAMLLAFLVGAGVLLVTGEIESARALGFVVGAVVVGAFGVVDDLRGLRPLHKLIGQILATSILLATGTVVEIIQLEPIATVLTFVWVIAITNAVNLLDNMDGLAAGVSLVAASLLAAHAFIAGIDEVAALAVLMVALILGFLPLNLRITRPAILFMGDGGSQLLGFGLAWLALAASWNHASSVVAAIAVPLLVLAVPILDTALVSLVRMIEGRPISQGGRDHTSHRLVVYGLSERRAVLLLIGASAVLGASSLLYLEYQSFAAVVIGGGLALAVLVHFALFLVQARHAGGVSGDAPADTGGWLSIDTYRLHKRRFAEGLVDLVLIVAAHYLAYILRYEQVPSGFNAERIAESLPFIIVARYGAFLWFGLYRGLWRYAGTRDVARAFIAVVVSQVVAVAALTLVYRFDGYSRTVFVIDAILCFMLIAGSRLAERGLGEWLHAMRDRRGVPRAIIVGAGDAGNALLRELRRRGELLVSGFIDDDPAKRGRRSQGTPVLGGHRDIELILDHHRPEVLYVTIPDAPAERLDRIEAAAHRIGARVTVVRNYGDTFGAPLPSAPSVEGN
jgi:UDP-GlcNAc:undecaprenyl-phosphate/decaprenyl-phosphate GlcNAc-1-phosphate transferase